jgi:non-specific serine/threonine protein kinase
VERPTQPALSSTLPAPRTRLIGRETDLDQLRALVLHGSGRLVTLTGAGGAGKTSLAVEVARRLSPSFSDGVFLVDLDLVGEPAGVIETVCATLGLIDRSRAPDSVLIEFLAARQALIVLDNSERLAPWVGRLADRLLDRCPDLRILATSRMPLHVRGETVFQVRPLTIPGPNATPAEAAAVPSVQLFVERARALRSDFTLTDDAAPAVASICRRVDGLPLAIELAAAHVAALSPEEVDARLTQDGRLPAETNRVGPARQQTMEATLDWSYRLLSSDQQAVLRRLAVFSGAWTLEDAEAVCAPRDLESVASSLVALVDASLLIREDIPTGGRFRLLVPVAEYARTRLEESGEIDPVRAAHAGHFLAVASRRDSGPLASAQDLEHIGAVYENAIGALRWAERTSTLPIVLGMTRALIDYWRIRGLLRAGLRHMERAMELAIGAPPVACALLLEGQADFHEKLGDHERARREAAEADRILEDAGETYGRPIANGLLGDVALGEGDLELARAHYDRAGELLDATGERRGLPLAFWSANVGAIALRQGRLDEAEGLLEQARAEFAAGPPVWYAGPVHTWLATIARLRGEPVLAKARLIEALAVLRRFGARVEAIDALEESALVALALGDPVGAATLLGAASGLRDATGMDFVRPRELASIVDRTRTSLPPDAFEAAWVLGRRFSLDDAFAFATEPSRPAVAAEPRASGFELLTRREREVAMLVADGLSNRDLAERLAISPGTARIHVERILSKLGLTSRVQIARWVLRGATPTHDEAVPL